MMPSGFTERSVAPTSAATPAVFAYISPPSFPESVTPSTRPGASAGAPAALPVRALQSAVRTPPPAEDAESVGRTATDARAADGAAVAADMSHQGRVSSEQKRRLPSYTAYAAPGVARPPAVPADIRTPPGAAVSADIATTAVGASGATIPACTFVAAAAHAAAATEHASDEEQREHEAEGSHSQHVFAAHQRGFLQQLEQQGHVSSWEWSQQQQQGVRQNPSELNQQQHAPHSGQHQIEEEEDQRRVVKQHQSSNDEVCQSHKESRASLATHIHVRSPPLRGMQRQQAAGRGQHHLAATANEATASTAELRTAGAGGLAANAAVYPTAAYPTEGPAVAKAASAGHVEAAAAAEAQSTKKVAPTMRDTITAKLGELEAAAPTVAAAIAGGEGRGKEAVDLLRQQARQTLEALRSDTRGCTYTETKRLDASLAQLQPVAEAVHNMVEELRRMHRHSLELKAKTENNLLLIERLKEEDKAFDEELAVLPQKLQSLSEYKATAEDELHALRNEYRLVSRQGEHALQAWDKKLSIYQHALGLRLQQNEQGGPTLVEFVDLQPYFNEDEQQQQLEYHEQQHLQQKEGKALENQEEKQERKCCCFSFRLAEGGRLAEAWSYPSIEMYGELAGAFAAGRISLAFLVATMRRQFKRLLQQHQKQQQQQQRLWRLQQQRQTWQHQRWHEQPELRRRKKASAAAEQAVTASPAGADAPVKAKFCAPAPHR